MQRIVHNNLGLLSWMPRMEKTTLDVSFVHFLLMFGYKLFSLFYPLYLASVGLSVLSIGNIYFLTYAVISVSCLLVNSLIHRINPASVAALGILGYGVFALLMLLSHDLRIFYLAQVILGVSAAAWLVSLKFILMNAKTESRTRSFAWFYSMPSYATAVAPALGGLIILKYGFPGVFLASVIIQFLNAIYAYLRLRHNGEVAEAAARAAVERGGTTQWERYREVFRILNGRRHVLMMLSFIFSALVLGGIYRAFFALLLKDLSFSQERAIQFMSAISFVYVPFSILVIKLMGRLSKTKVVSAGIALEGVAALILGVFYHALGAGALFVLNILDSMGALALGSGKSAYFAKKLDGYREEASTIDSVMTTLGPALGGMLGGMLVAALGYRLTFFWSGTVILVMGAASFFLDFRERER